jgi:predicted ester cyclase
MPENENLRITRETFDAWNAHDPDRYVKQLDEGWIAESDTMPAPVSGHTGAKEFMKTYISAFPDLRFDIDQMLASGEFVVTRWTATGTHRGALMGIPPRAERV